MTRWTISARLVRTTAVICAALVAGSLAAAATESAPDAAPLFARGINLSGAELNGDRQPAVYGTDYIYPTLQELDYYAAKGFRVVRLPYRWERLQPVFFGKLDRIELDRIKSFVAAAGARHMRVILTPCNFGRYFIDGKQIPIGTSAVPTEAFADFSYRTAAAFAGNRAVYGISLMNEPHDFHGQWKAIAQAALNAIRRADRDRLVLLPGDGWSEALNWRRNNDDFVLDDPTGRVVYEAHQYFDLDHSGTYKTGYAASGATPDRGVEFVRPFAEWLKQHHVRGIITELGVPNDDPRWFELTGRLLAYLAQEQIPWTYWAGGPWWGNYALSTEPRNGVDAPIMAVLTKRYPQ